MDRLLLYLHILANLGWIGAILATALILTGAEGSPQVRGQIARRIYLTLAVPNFVLAVVFGLWGLLSNLQYYFVTTKFMHAKLLFALVVIGLHHVIGAQAKRMAKGQSNPGRAALSGALLAGGVAAAAFLAVMKPF